MIITKIQEAMDAASPVLIKVTIEHCTEIYTHLNQLLSICQKMADIRHLSFLCNNLNFIGWLCNLKLHNTVKDLN